MNAIRRNRAVSVLDKRGTVRDKLPKAHLSWAMLLIFFGIALNIALVLAVAVESYRMIEWLTFG